MVGELMDVSVCILLCILTAVSIKNRLKGRLRWLVPILIAFLLMSSKYLIPRTSPEWVKVTLSLLAVAVVVYALITQSLLSREEN